MTIYVGNLAYAATVEGLKELFAPHGEIIKVIIPTDRDTGRPRGFAFVEMGDESDEDSTCAFYENQDLEYLDRMLKINKAKPKEEGGARSPRPPRSFGGDRPQRSGGNGGFGGRSGERKSSFGGPSSGGANGGRSGERRPRRNYDN
jgi:RNA recognition motif-containing protein